MGNTAGLEGFLEKENLLPLLRFKSALALRRGVTQLLNIFHAFMESEEPVPKNDYRILAYWMAVFHMHCLYRQKWDKSGINLANS